MWNVLFFCLGIREGGRGESLTGPKITSILPAGAHPLRWSKMTFFSPFFWGTSKHKSSQHNETGNTLCHVLSSLTTLSDCFCVLCGGWVCRCVGESMGGGFYQSSFAYA